MYIKLFNIVAAIIGLMTLFLKIIGAAILCIVGFIPFCIYIVYERINDKIQYDRFCKKNNCDFSVEEYKPGEFWVVKKQR